MAKDKAFMGVAAVGGLGLGYALSKLMGGKASASLEAIAANLFISRDPPNQYWLDRKFLFSYTNAGWKAALYAFCYNDGIGHINNVEVIVSISDKGDGTFEFECALMSGDRSAAATYRVYYNGIPKLSLTAYPQVFTV
jgi:hypothetical protein